MISTKCHSFFKWRSPFSHMLRLFQDSFIFRETASPQLFKVTTLTKQLHFRISYFFKEAAYSKEILLQNSHSPQQLFFQNSYVFGTKLLTSSDFFGIRSSLGKLLFGTAAFLGEGLFRIKISTEKLLFRSRYFCTASTFSEELHFEKRLIFQKSNISALPTFSVIRKFFE